MKAIEFSTTRYEFSHGRKPRGRGMWAFEYTPRGQTQERIIFAPGNMTLTEAKTFIAPLLEEPRLVHVAP